MPRTIDKLRSQLPGGVPNGYFINAETKGISGFLLDRLGVSEGELRNIVGTVECDSDVATWLRARVDVTKYPSLNETLQRIEPRHAENPDGVRELYAVTLAAHPELRTIVDIIDADDRRLFPRLR